MSSKSLLALPLLAALLLSSLGDTTSASEPSPQGPSAGPKHDPIDPFQPEPEQPLLHTMTIYNGTCVTRRTFVYLDGTWRDCEDFKRCEVLVRDCPTSRWHLHRTCSSFRHAEEAASSLRAQGKLASIRFCRNKSPVR
jgi:hypothetical protein